MSAVLMGWGPFRFEVGRAAYEELTHSAEARWEKHPIIGRRPAPQYLGPGEEVVTLRGTLYTEGRQAVADMVRDLVRAAQGGQAYMLVSADGAIVDLFRLEKARRVESHHLPTAQAQKVEYDLEFHVHVDGEGGIWSLWP